MSEQQAERREASPDHRASWPGAVAIVVVALAAHGLWLFNDGVFYDAWLEWAAGTYGKWSMLQGWFDDSGMPQVGWLHRVLMRSPSPQFTYALVGFSCWAGVALLVRATARQLGATDGDATLAGMLVVAARVGCVGVSFIHAPYFIALFALGVAGHLFVIDAVAPSQPTVRAVVAHRAMLYVALFFISMMPSCFVAFYFFLFLLLVRKIITKRSARPLIYFLDLLILPALSFVAQRHWYPTQNGYEGNNTLGLGSRMTDVATQMINATLLDSGTEALAAPLWLLAVGAAVAAIIGWRSQRAPDGRRALIAVVFVAAWLAAALFPYAVVNKASQAGRMFTWRHGLLLAFAPAFFFLAVSFGARGWRVAHGAWAAVAGILIAGQAFTAAFIHSEWLAAAAKQRSIIIQARAAPLVPVPEVVWFADYMPTPHRSRTVSYELTGLVSAALGVLHAGALPWAKKNDIESYRIGYFWYYLLPEFRGDGPHATLTAVPRRPINRNGLAGIGLDYAAARLAFSGDDFARDLLTVTLAPTEPPANWAAKVAEAERARTPPPVTKKVKRKKRRPALPDAPRPVPTSIAAPAAP